MGLTQAALEWYHLAAQQGESHAMLRLYEGSACVDRVGYLLLPRSSGT